MNSQQDFMSVQWMCAPGVRTIFGIVFLGILISGCRSYGGYGTEEATYQQILEAHQVFEEELSRKQADLRGLEQAAASAEGLETAAGQFAQLVQGHEAILAEHSILISDLSADSDYRTLHRVFGAIVTQHNTIRSQYEDLIATVAQTQSPQADSVVQVQRPYSLIPPYYRRVSEKQKDLTMNEVLAQARTGAQSISGFATSGADTTTRSSTLNMSTGADSVAAGQEDPERQEP